MPKQKRFKYKRSRKKLNKWMKKSWYWFGREWAYKNVKPRIICEKFMTKNNISPDDYKFFCFNGEPKCLQTDNQRFHEHTQEYYTVGWELMDLNRGVPSIGKIKDKPANFDEMLKISKILSEGIKHVRVDLYDVDGKIYFGELTFFDGSGFWPFEPEYNDDLLGSWLDLRN